MEQLFKINKTEDGVGTRRGERRAESAGSFTLCKDGAGTRRALVSSLPVKAENNSPFILVVTSKRELRFSISKVSR